MFPQVGTEIRITIAGNKCDLEKNRAVPEEEALSYSESVGATHVYTSAKLNKGLDDAFAGLSKRMAERRNQKLKERPGSSKRGLVLADEPLFNPVEPKKQGCC